MRFGFTASLVLGLAVTMIGGCSCGGHCRTPLLAKLQSRMASRRCVVHCECQATCACQVQQPADNGVVPIYNFQSPTPQVQPTPAPTVAPVENTSEGDAIPVAPQVEPEVAIEDTQASHLDLSSVQSSRLTNQNMEEDPTDSWWDEDESSKDSESDAQTPAIPASSTSSIYRSREPEVLEAPPVEAPPVEAPPVEVDVESMESIEPETLPAKTFESAPSPSEVQPVAPEHRVANVGSVKPKKHVANFPIIRLHAMLPPAHDEKVSPIVKLHLRQRVGSKEKVPGTLSGLK